jgi:hypothetical protein
MPTLESLSLPRLIAVTGQEGSGKDTYSEHLAERGYMHVSAGDVIRDRARAEGYADPISRDILSQVGDRFKQEFGLSPITQSSLANYEKNADTYPAGLVISGLRRAGELEAFKKHGAVILWIDAAIEKRYKHQANRARGDHQDLTSFTEQSQREYLGTTDRGSIGVNLQAVEALADCRVSNDSTIEELTIKADEALAKHSRF